MALGLAPFAATNAASLKFNDEDAANITAMQASGTVTSVQVSSPVFCANIASPVLGFDKFVNLRNGNFVFGGMNAGQQVPLRGVASWNYSPDSLTLVTDPNLVCYVTGPNGVRRATLGIFSDTFEPTTFDPMIQTRVVQLPTINNAYVYKYYIDITIPAIPTSTELVPIAVSDGFDGALFSASGSYFCEGVGQNSTDCRGGATHNNIAVAVAYSAQAGLATRYIVTRPLLPGMTSLPVSSSPVTAAALFLPEGFDPRLDNNVAPSYGSLTDARPEINSAAAVAALATLTEGGSLTGVPITLDDDTSETAGSLLGATATLTFNGIDFPVTVNCGSATPIPATPRVTRNCTFDVVTPDTNYATDVAVGAYAPGVTAKLKLVATDARNQTTTVDFDVHVASVDNDKPVFAISPLAVPDQLAADMPTLTCSLVNKGSAQCAGLVNEFLTGLAPAPDGATDELAAQTAAFVQDTSTGRGGNIACVLDTDSPQIFGLTGAPRLTSSGGGAKVNLAYVLNEAQGSATCTVVVRDAGTFYTGQIAANETKQFRIKVTP